MAVRIQQDYRGAIPRLRHALEMYKKAYDADPARLQNRILIARTKAELGNAIVREGKRADGVSLLNGH